eukprot:365928-Chlamydomonas_euryale.AAC.11
MFERRSFYAPPVITTSQAWRPESESMQNSYEEDGLGDHQHSGRMACGNVKTALLVLSSSVQPEA